MFQFHRKISRRFFLAAVFIAFLPIGITGYVSHVLTRQALTGAAYMHMETIARDHAKHLMDWLQERLDDVATLTRLPGFKDTVERYCCTLEDGSLSENLSVLLQQNLSVTQQRSSSYESLRVVLHTGRLAASTRKDDANGRQDVKTWDFSNSRAGTRSATWPTASTPWPVACPFPWPLYARGKTP